MAGLMLREASLIKAREANARKGAHRRFLIVGAIRDYTAAHGYAPTIREIAAGVGLRSTSNVAHHLRQLQADRVIERDPVRARAIRILP